MYSHQSTVARATAVSGVALHSGLHVTATLRPAPPDHGVVFARVDLPGKPRLPARVSEVGKARLATRLEREGAFVVTVEHLLAALASEGISNVLVEVDGPELPVLDGSSVPWLRVLDQTGRRSQDAARRRLCLRKPVEVRDGERWMRATPARGLLLDVTLDFAQTPIGVQRVVWRQGWGTFRAELAWARTFAFLRDVTQMRAHQLALGGGLDNAMVFSELGPLDPSALRTPDEPARHKVLDLLGDLSLLGHPLHARVTAVRPGHALTAALMRKLLHSVELTPLT